MWSCPIRISICHTLPQMVNIQSTWVWRLHIGGSTLCQHWPDSELISGVSRRIWYEGTVLTETWLHSIHNMWFSRHCNFPSTITCWPNVWPMSFDVSLLVFHPVQKIIALATFIDCDDLPCLHYTISIKQFLCQTVQNTGWNQIQRDI